MSLPPSLSANKRHYKPSPVTDLYSRTRWPRLHSPHPLWDDAALLLLHQPPAEIFMGTCERLKKSWGAANVLPAKASRWERHLLLGLADASMTSRSPSRCPPTLLPLARISQCLPLHCRRDLPFKAERHDWHPSPTQQNPSLTTSATREVEEFTL